MKVDLPRWADLAHTSPSSIVPGSSVTGRTLMLLIAIMTFLTCVTFGTVIVVQKSAAGWSAEVSRQMTIIVTPQPDLDMASTLRTAVDIAQASPGVGSAHALSQKQGEALLRPWLGDNIDLTGLAVPRLIAVNLSDPRAFRVSELEKSLASVPGARLETHDGWRQQLGVMAGTMVAAGLFVLALILGATTLAVIFATRGTMTSNREIVDVLHFIGASNGFIAAEFQGRFLRIGLAGGLAGGVFALVFFMALGTLTSALLPQSAGDQIGLLFGSFWLGWDGILGLLAIVPIVAGLTALTSRLTVRRFLEQLT